VGHAACMTEKENVLKVTVGKPEGKNSENGKVVGRKTL
jgi:hypothetical protein